jgi:Mg2+/Co2+ transporter CorB
MSTEKMEILSGTINELLLILKEIDFFIDSNKQLNGQLRNLSEEKQKLHDIINELSGRD